MTDRSSIAVLLSVYNGEKYIEEQIDSILHQDTACSVTLFVRDDASEDRTMEILKGYASEGKLILFTGEHVGPAVSFFSLLEEAYQKGAYRWFAFADQDDVWLPEKLQCAVEMLEQEENATPLLYGSRSLVTDSKLRIRGKTCIPHRPITFRNTFVQNIVSGHTQVMNAAMAQLILEGGLPDGVFSIDHFFANLAAVRGKILFDVTSHTLYRQHGKNLMGYNIGFFLWFLARIKRLRSGEGLRNVLQMHATVQAVYDYLPEDGKKAVDRFFSCRESFCTRLSYVRNMPFYRQKRAENVIFCLYYLLGGYNQ